MICPICGHENKDNAKFCDECEVFLGDLHFHRALKNLQHFIMKKQLSCLLLKNQYGNLVKQVTGERTRNSGAI